MKTIRTHLDIAFHLASPEGVLRGLKLSRFPQQKDTIPIRAEGMSCDYYYHLARKRGNGQSKDDLESWYQDMEQTCAHETRMSPSLFQLLIQFGDEVLVVENGEPLCRREELLRWRMTSLDLGQDLFTTSYLAYLDAMHAQNEQTYFTWPAQIRTNDPRLKQLFHEGLAENHFHLYGSTQSFALIWVALMNHPEGIYRWLHPRRGRSRFQINRSGAPTYGVEDNQLPWDTRLYYAAWLRANLFQRVCRGGRATSDEMKDKFLTYTDSMEYSREPARLIQRLRYWMGAKFQQASRRQVCLDYAIHKNARELDLNNHCRLLRGERELLYYCFLACFTGEFSSSEQDLFYLYLLIKSQFRNEVIQTNREVGFANFSLYQDRKTDFWGGYDMYWVEAQRLAVNATLSNGVVRSLEARFTPRDTPQGTINEICMEDAFVLRQEHGALWPEGNVRNLSPESRTRLPFFYVLHFIKQKENPKLLEQDAGKTMERCHCRNFRTRKTIQRQAISLSIALEKDDYLCTRLRGIDAASSELDCRPEVFATEFRYLRHFTTVKPRQSGLHGARIMHRLGVAYHVGEDFRDLASGLRAVDEALTFLNLGRGDRLGHALALGVEPDIHYATKKNTVLLPKQDRLDDLVWLLMRAKEFNVVIPNTLRLDMEQEAEELLDEIYGSERGRYTLREYWQAWYLRGDHPDSYQFGLPKQKNARVMCGASQLQYEQFYLDDRREAKQSRQLSKLANLYRRYQFGYGEKERGRQVQPVHITEPYIAFLREMQNCMQAKVLERGVVIECNPSSNVKIGTFGRYDKHPIFRFYDIDPSNTRGRQLSVSINTDDLGVFDTSLEMEYALLAECLAVQVEPDGNKRYSEEVIYNYLETLRKLGWTQRFEPPAMPLDQSGSTLRRWENKEILGDVTPDKW